jgi:hypothetical protein
VAPTAGTPAPYVNLTISNPPQQGGLWSTSTQLGSAVASSSVIWSSNPLPNGAQGGQLELTLYSPAFIGSGTYHDTVKVWVCTDQKCANPIQGSPVSIAVTYTVTGNVVSDASYAIVPTGIDLESPSNAAAPSATVNVTAYDVPPYGAYVFYASQTGGPVASMSFKQTQGNTEPYAYGTGVLTVNMKTPASLGPGVYNDVVTLSICYDQACTKPAAGTPFTIPVTYTVTASAGREFQEQILDQNFTALAVDPTGTILYAATPPSALNAPTSTPAQLIQINPVSLATTTLVSLPAEMDQIVVSSDGQYIYLVTSPFAPTTQVVRVRTSDMTIDQTVTLTGNGAQIAISPVTSSTWSAAFGANTAVATVEILDNSVARPDVWSVTNTTDLGPGAVWSADGSTLYISDPITNTLSSVPVSSSGLGSATLLQSGQAFSGQLQLAGGLLYSESGSVLNPGTNTVVGQYSFPSGVPDAALAIDPVNNRVFASYQQPLSTGVQGTIQSFNLAQFTPLWIARFPSPGQPLRWGVNGLAWLGPSPTVTGAGALYVINGTFVAP